MSEAKREASHAHEAKAAVERKAQEESGKLKEALKEQAA